MELDRVRYRELLVGGEVVGVAATYSTATEWAQAAVPFIWGPRPQPDQLGAWLTRAAAVELFDRRWPGHGGGEDEILSLEILIRVRLRDHPR
jgi:hypothetical protein